MMPNQYKIGDFSKYMGVTPDFLKHYEQYGLIPPAISESGYRYYRFEMASETLECIKLRNWEFSLKEIQRINKEMSLDEIRQAYQIKIEEMKQQVIFYQAVIEEQERMEKWFDSYTKDFEDWTIKKIEPMIFLPHSNNRDFLHDERIYTMMEQWVQWMPIVHSCQRIFNFMESDTPQFHWGFSVSEDLAKKYGLHSSEPCIHIPRQRCLVVPLTRNVLMTNGSQTDCTALIKTILNDHNLTSTGEIYREVYQYSHQHGIRKQHCSLIVPLK